MDDGISTERQKTKRGFTPNYRSCVYYGQDLGKTTPVYGLDIYRRENSDCIDGRGIWTKKPKSAETEMEESDTARRSAIERRKQKA